MSNYYSMKQLVSMIDTELKQGQKAHRTTLTDSMRLAKEAEIIAWVNQALGELLEYNKGSFYYRVLDFTPLADSTVLELPFFFRRLDKIKMDNTWYDVGMPTDDAAAFHYLGGRKIMGNKKSFTKDNTILLQGYVSPDNVVDTESFIDFPPSFIRLLLLQVLLYFAARDNRKKELYYAQYRLLLSTYKKASANVAAHGKTKSKINFGGN